MERKPLRGCAPLAPLVGQNDDPIDPDRRTANLNAFKLHSQFTDKWLSSFSPSRGFRSSRARYKLKKFYTCFGNEKVISNGPILSP